MLADKKVIGKVGQANICTYIYTIDMLLFPPPPPPFLLANVYDIYVEQRRYQIDPKAP